MYVTWNGTNVTGPELIYHDEVIQDGDSPPYTVGNPNRPGALVCRSETDDAIDWWWPHNFSVVEPVNNRGFHQVKEQNGTISRVSRTTFYNVAADNTPNRNGLWTCRLGDYWFPVGLFYREGGKRITQYYNSYL